MKKTNLLYVLMSFLAFSILFGGIYFIVEEEIILGGALTLLSLISILVIFFLLKKQNTEEVNTNIIEPKVVHYKKHEIQDAAIEVHKEKLIQTQELTSEPENDQDFIRPTAQEEDLELPIVETIEEAEEVPIEEDDVSPVESKDPYEFKVIVNDTYDKEIKDFISKMLDQNMFLESLEYRYDLEEIRSSDLEDQNIYKYEFHPIPMISLVKDFKNKEIIKIMIGLNTKEMVHVGYVPQKDIETVNENYHEIKNIKANLSGGTYRVLEKNSTIVRQYTDPFIIKLRIYL